MTNDTGINDVGAAMRLSQLPSQAAKPVSIPEPNIVQGSDQPAPSAAQAPAPNSPSQPAAE